MFVSNCLNWLKGRQECLDGALLSGGGGTTVLPASGSSSLTRLAKALRGDVVEVHQDAQKSPGSSDDGDAINALLEAFCGPDSKAHTVATHTLEQTLKGASIPTNVVALLGNEDPAIRNRAAALLARLDWSPENVEEEAFFAAAQDQFLKAASYGVAAIEPLDLAVRTAASNLRSLAVEALGRIRDARAVPPLLEALHSGNASLMIASIRALGQLAAVAAFEPIGAALKHEDARVRMAAVEALPRVDAARAPEVLIGMLQDSNWDIRRATAECLGQLNCLSAVEPLIRSLSDLDADVRETAAIALGALHDRRAIGPLVVALKDPTSGVRRIAAKALLGIDENWQSSEEARAAVEELKEAMRDKNPDVRYAVGRLLQSFGITPPETIRYLPELTYYYELQQSLGALSSGIAGSAPEVLSVTDLEKRRKLATTLMMATLCDGDHDLRRAAAHALGRLGDPRAENALRRAARDSNAGVRQAVEASLNTLSLVRRTETTHKRHEHGNTTTDSDIGKLHLAGSA